MLVAFIILKIALFTKNNLFVIL